MEIVKAFTSNKLHTNITIKGDINNPLFRANDIGVVLEISNIRTSINDFDETEKVVHSMDTLGGNQQVTFLTEKGLYKVLFKSRKSIAEKFQNWVCEVIKELRLNGFYDLQKEIQNQNTKINQIEDIHKQELVKEREKILLKEYGTIGSIVYIIKVKSYENSQYVVKIGESRKGINERYKEHKHKFEECVLLDCFAVNNVKDFESFIHNHETIRPNKVTDLLGHENELELFLIGKNMSYHNLINIIHSNIKYFNNINSTHKLELENEQLKLMLEMKNNNNDNLIVYELVKNVKQMSCKIDNLEKINKEILNKLNSQETKVVNGFNEPLTNVGPRLQKINPETMQLIKVYECVTELMKEDDNIKRPSINKAVVENTIYCGYRWLLVDRELDPNIIHNIYPTKQTKIQNLGYISQLDKEQSTIINVFIDRKTAAHSNGYASASALDNPVKNFTLSNGFYYKLYDDCDLTLREQFEEIYGKPLLYKNGIGKYDLQNNLIQEFSCKYDCIRELKISDKTLAKSLTKNISYNNFYFKEIGSKLKCV